MSDQGSGFVSAVPWLLVIGGWFIGNYQNNQREHRKETRALQDAFIKFADELERDAVLYHTQADKTLLSHDIRRRLSRLGAMLSTVGARGLDIAGAQRTLTAFRQAITGENFDSASYQELKGDSPQILEIGKSRDRLINALELAFTNKFYR